MTDREIIERLDALIERHSEQIALLTKVQLDQHKILRDHAALLREHETDRHEQRRHMLALAEAINHLAEKIGAAQ